jgi:hypothetical protein
VGSEVVFVLMRDHGQLAVSGFPSLHGAIQHYSPRRCRLNVIVARTLLRSKLESHADESGAFLMNHV